MMTSPTLNTFANGHDAGIAKTSPRKSRFGSASTSEFTNPLGSASRPAVRTADAEAGITPPFATMAIPFSTAPTAISHRPGIVRFAHTNARPTGNDATCAVIRHASAPPGIANAPTCRATAVTRSHSDRNLRSSSADSFPDAIGTSAPANATNTTSGTEDPFVLAFRPATSPIGGPILVPEPSIGDAGPRREGMSHGPNGILRRRTLKPPVRRVIRANGRWLGVGTPIYGNDDSNGLLSRTTTRPIATPGRECQRPARGAPSPRLSEEVRRQCRPS